MVKAEKRALKSEARGLSTTYDQVSPHPVFKRIKEQTLEDNIKLLKSWDL